MIRIETLPAPALIAPPVASFAYTDADVARFMSFVEALPCGCHFWTGARSRGRGNRKWYGSFWVDGMTIRAHRFSCEAIGKRPPLPPGWHRDHTCLFSLCVNEAHIEYVTHEENQRRKVARTGLKKLERLAA